MNSPDEKRFKFLISEACKQGNYNKATDLKKALDIYLVSRYLNIHDWQKIRTYQFWETHDKLPFEKQRAYLLECIKKYIENKKRTKILYNEK
jgi:hypothetical protein